LESGFRSLVVRIQSFSVELGSGQQPLDPPDPGVLK
jgi:hypothetical protein